MARLTDLGSPSREVASIWNPEPQRQESRNPQNKSARKIKKNQNVFCRFAQKIQNSKISDFFLKNLRISRDRCAGALMTDYSFAKYRLALWLVVE